MDRLIWLRTIRITGDTPHWNSVASGFFIAAMITPVQRIYAYVSPKGLSEKKYEELLNIRKDDEFLQWKRARSAQMSYHFTLILLVVSLLIRMFSPGVMGDNRENFGAMLGVVLMLSYFSRLIALQILKGRYK